MPSPSVPQLIRGTTSFLKTGITGLLSGMNADLADAVVSSNPGSTPPVFSFQIGNVPSSSSCLICVSWVALGKQRIATAPVQKAISLPFKITCKIPQAGANTPSNYEMARQVSAEWIWNWLEDDRYTLTPSISAGTFGTIKALDSDHGEFSDIYPMMLADGHTVIHGWSVTWTPRFSVSQ